MHEKIKPSKLVPARLTSLLDAKIPEDKDELWDLIERMNAGHRYLDRRVREEEEKPNNRDTVNQMKMKKLKLKDLITRLEAELVARIHQEVFGQ